MAFDTLKKSEFWKKKIRAAVAARDANKDGFISRADFDLVIQHYQDAGCSPGHIKKLRESFENLLKACNITDGKKMTCAEFEERWKESLEGSFACADERYSAMFELVDLNANNEISLKEWEIHCKAFSEISPEHAKLSFEAMDANGDRKISRQEFINYHKEYFYSTDDKLKSSILYGPLK